MNSIATNLHHFDDHNVNDHYNNNNNDDDDDDDNDTDQVWTLVLLLSSVAAVDLEQDLQPFQTQVVISLMMMMVAI